MNYAVEMGSRAMIHIPRFIKIGSIILPVLVSVTREKQLSKANISK